MDHHTLATISICGSSLDVLGTLYLAYDLLGGQHGPLRLLTRMVTYSLVFGLGFGLGFGLFFGLVSGIATGVTIAIELNRAARGRAAGAYKNRADAEPEHYSLPWEAVFSTIRGMAFGVGLYRVVGVRFAVLFAVLVSVGPVFAYWRGLRPATNYAAGRRPRLTRRQIVGTAVRTVGYTIAALICGAVEREHVWAFAITVGVLTGLVTGAGTAVIPLIEYYADNLPQRRLGVFGIGLILCGFALQSVQYWLSLFDLKVS